MGACPLTENAVPRIVGHPRHPNSPGSPAPVLAALTPMWRLCRPPGHEFWPDDLSLRDGSRFDPDRLLDGAQITDTCLLGLAVAHGGRLATVGRRLVADAVRGGQAALELLRG
jgi:hypothetical protein